MPTYSADWINYYLDYYNSWLNAPRFMLFGIAMKESGYNPQTGAFQNVCNYLGACGLMQLRPIAVKDLANNFGINVDRNDALQSVLGAALMFLLNYRYLSAKGYTPNWESLIVAYNGGWTAGAKYLASGSAPTAEGRDYLAYVERVVYQA